MLNKNRHINVIGFFSINILFILACIMSFSVTSAFSAENNNKTLSITANDVEKIVLEQSFSVKQAHLKSQYAKQSILESKGTFDTNLNS